MEGKWSCTVHSPDIHIPANLKLEGVGTPIGVANPPKGQRGARDAGVSGSYRANAAQEDLAEL